MSHPVIAADARLYFRPLWFADTPVGLAESDVLRLAGTLLWFQGVEVRWVSERDGKGGRAILPVAELRGWIASLPAEPGVRAQALLGRLTAPRSGWRIGQRALRFEGPQVMGILNMTPDSFSDGGRYADDLEAAVQAGFAMQLAGVSIVDVGGESTRPGAAAVWEGDEIARIVPVIERLAKADIVVSADTRKASVMEAALAAGAGVINDISGLTHDPRARDVVAGSNCPVVLMHSPSSGEDPHGGREHYGSATRISGPLAVFDWLDARIAACEAAGIGRERIMADPGIGFGTTLADDTATVNMLALFHGLGVPILLGASRKRIVGALSKEAPVDQRLGGSLALALNAFAAGCQMVRVHDVAETVQAAQVWRGLRDAALTADMGAA